MKKKENIPLLGLLHLGCTAFAAGRPDPSWSCRPHDRANYFDPPPSTASIERQAAAVFVADAANVSVEWHDETAPLGESTSFRVAYEVPNLIGRTTRLWAFTSLYTSKPVARLPRRVGRVTRVPTGSGTGADSVEKLFFWALMFESYGVQCETDGASVSYGLAESSRPWLSRSSGHPAVRGRDPATVLAAMLASRTNNWMNAVFGTFGLHLETTPG